MRSGCLLLLCEVKAYPLLKACPMDDMENGSKRGQSELQGLQSTRGHNHVERLCMGK